jgi:hypothetical protein
VLAPILEPVGPVLDPILAPVGPVLDPILAPVDPVLEPVLTPVLPIVSPVFPPVTTPPNPVLGAGADPIRSDAATSTLGLDPASNVGRPTSPLPSAAAVRTPARSGQFEFTTSTSPAAQPAVPAARRTSLGQPSTPSSPSGPAVPVAPAAPAPVGGSTPSSTATDGFGGIAAILPNHDRALHDRASWLQRSGEARALASRANRVHERPD